MTQLRGYQTALKAGIYDAWQRGARNVVGVTATGSGKTVTMASMAAELGGIGRVQAHRAELVGQLSIALGQEGLRHNIVAAKSTVKAIAAAHMEEFGRIYYDPRAAWAVGSVQTLVRRNDPDAHRVQYVFTDEGHHVLADNTWGKGMQLYPNARGLLMTATPTRADGKGLGRHHDGLADAMVLGPGLREQIEQGFLTGYKVAAPTASDLDMSDVHITASGDYNAQEAARAVKRSRKIVGDAVENYQALAAGKLAIVFAADIEHGETLAAAFNAAGVPAAMVTGDTEEADRRAIMRKFKARELRVLVNVDLFGEGVDVPAVEVVIMCRPTASFALYCLDPETEVLTPDGWKGIDEIESIQTVIAFDPKTGATRAVPVTDRVRRNRFENMYGIESPQASINVSDKHRMLVKSVSATAKNWQFETADTVAERKNFFNIPVAGNGMFPGCGLSDSELHLIGWLLSDGYINRKTNAMQISQASNKAKHIDHIRSSLQGCGMKFAEETRQRISGFDTSHDTTFFRVSKGTPRGTGKHLRGYGYLAEWLDKSIPAIFDTMTRREFLTMLHALWLGDGANGHVPKDYTKRTLEIAIGDNERMADRLQALAVQRGIRCSKATRKSQLSDKNVHTLRFKPESDTVTVGGKNIPDGNVNGREYQRSRFAKNDSQPDEVWCLENELSTLVTRRRGKVAIIGNCQCIGRMLRLNISPILMAAWDTFTAAQRLAHIAASVKPFGILIDHVGNVYREFNVGGHKYSGLPEGFEKWTLDRRQRRASNGTGGEPLRMCLGCFKPYERALDACPHPGCNTAAPEPAARGGPQQVDGDLRFLDDVTLARLRGAITVIDGSARIPQNAPPHVQASAIRLHHERQAAQALLRAAMAQWAGWHHTDSLATNYKRFYFRFGVDVLSAMTLGAGDAGELMERINTDMEKYL